MRYLLAAVVALLLMAPTSAGARPQNGPLIITVTHHNSGGEVEQQPGAWNPTACMWTIDDHHRASGFGYLNAGASVSDSYCQIADGHHEITGVSVSAPSPDLVVTLTYEPQGVSFTLPARAVGRDFEYRGCVTGPIYGNWPALEEVPGSNGGRGRQTQITVTVTNPTERRVRNVGVHLETGSEGFNARENFCYGEKTDFVHLGNDQAVWRTGV